MRVLCFYKRTNKKAVREILMILCVCMLSSLAFFDMPVRAETDTLAVSFEELNADNVFVKQSARGECTLAAATMLVRRAALLAGNPNWDSITDNTLRSVAWAPGLYYGSA